MKASFDVQYWLHRSELDELSPQPLTSRTRNRSWYFEPVSFSGFNHPIETIVSRIEADQADLTVNYHHWWDIGFALARELGESGRTYYHRISRFNARYSPDRCNKQYDSSLKGKGPSMAVNSFFHLVKEAGYDSPWRATNLRVIWKEEMIHPTDLFDNDDFFEDQSMEEQSPEVEPIAGQPTGDIFTEDQPSAGQPAEDGANADQHAEGAPIPGDPYNEDLVFNTPPLHDLSATA